MFWRIALLVVFAIILGAATLLYDLPRGIAARIGSAEDREIRKAVNGAVHADAFSPAVFARTMGVKHGFVCWSDWSGAHWMQRDDTRRIFYQEVVKRCPGFDPNRIPDRFVPPVSGEIVAIVTVEDCREVHATAIFDDPGLSALSSRDTCVAIGKE